MEYVETFARFINMVCGIIKKRHQPMQISNVKSKVLSLIPRRGVSQVAALGKLLTGPCLLRAPNGQSVVCCRLRKYAMNGGIMNILGRKLVNLAELKIRNMMDKS